MFLHYNYNIVYLIFLKNKRNPTIQGIQHLKETTYEEKQSILKLYIIKLVK